jgi:hypothetical protein
MYASPHGRLANLHPNISLISVHRLPNVSHHLSFSPFSRLLMSSSSTSGRRGQRGGGRGSGPSGHSGRSRGRGRGVVPPNNRAGGPRGICDFYWSTGACNRNFDCTFRHEVRPGVQVSSSAPQSTDYTPDFFSPEGLAINNGSILDPQHNLCPSEAHNHLKLYLSDNYVFRNAISVEGFSRILASVNSRNRAWVRNNLEYILMSSNREIGF